MRTFIITGATSGLGLAIAKSLALKPKTRVVLAVRDINRGKSIAATIGHNAEVVELDLISLDNIDVFVSSWAERITGVINNAGIQIVNETRFTKNNGFEETFAVNHMAALKLTIGMLPFLDGGRVLFIGSGTHNPNNKAATMFGFRGARFTSIKACAAGLDETGPIGQIGLDRYATSKFLNMVTTIELARRIPAERVSFFCLDPGMMPGTGLARTSGAFLRFVWSSILPFASKFLPDTSTTEQSGGAAAWIMTSKELNHQTGTVFSFDRNPSKLVWNPALEPEIGKRVIDDSLNMMGLEIPSMA